MAKLFIGTVLVVILCMLALLTVPGSEMKSVYIVEVQDPKKPTLPDSCVVCGTARGEGLTTIAMSDEQGRVDFYLYGISDKAAQGTLLDIPVHDTCARGVRNDFLKRFFLILLVAALVVALGILIKCSIWLSIVIALLTTVPFLYIQLTKPVPVEFLYSGKTYVLLFKDRNYAEAVARLNDSVVRVRENPYTDARP